MIDLVSFEERALFHLELLGCYAPEDARVPSPFDGEADAPDDWDEDDDGYDCTRCGGEGFSDVDDPLWDECDEFGWGPCNACHGTGLRKHQWVF